MMDPTSHHHGTVGLKERLTRYQKWADSAGEAVVDSELANMAGMTEEQRLAHISKLTAPKGCKKNGCYGRGYVARRGDEYVLCACTKGSA